MLFFQKQFPRGEGAYDGRISLHDYLKYRMSMLFSPFALFKPYLLFMYDLCQSIQILQHSSKTCLEKDVKNINLQNPTMLEVDIINHITKFHFAI